MTQVGTVSGWEWVAREARLRNPLVGCGWHRLLYNVAVEKSVQGFSSFQEHDLATAREDMRLTPAERIQIVIELRDRQHPDAAKQGLARVCRIIKLQQS